MKFGEEKLENCLNAYLAHSFSHGELRIKKGTKLNQSHIDQLSDMGKTTLIVAKLDEHDLHEDQAANLLGEWCISQGIRREDSFTGRVNFYAEQAGMFCVDKTVITKFNAVHPAITLATLHDQTPVEQGRMLATLKIIPFAAPKAACDEVAQILKEALPFCQKPFQGHRIGLISTHLPHIKQSVIDKTAKTLAKRLKFAGSHISSQKQVPHSVEALTEAIERSAKQCDMVIVFGASATIDSQDVVPHVITSAGGDVERFGMPVDPGNLLVLGTIGKTPVIGAPSCARSPAENGFDFVLYRLLSGQKVRAHDIAEMGVGGLLKEIHSRPQPREVYFMDNQEAQKPKIAALILAAGQSRRMGVENKLLLPFKDKPILAHVVEAVKGSNCSKTHVVTGHEADRVAQSLNNYGLSNHEIEFIHNPYYDKGLSTSIFAGISALETSYDGVLVLLGDMPKVTSEMINQMIDNFDPDTGISIVQAAHKGKGGNPVLWGAQYFEALLELEGDMGARPLMARYESAMMQVELGEDVFLDVDTKQVYQELSKEE